MDRTGALWPYMLPHNVQGSDSLCSVSAQGVRVRFADGSERLDGSSGLWNANLGFGNWAIAGAVADAMVNASYLSSWSFENQYTRSAADALVELIGRDYSRVIFSTSGGAANEVCMKIARHYHALRGESSRKIVLGLRNGFHGLTYGAFALTDAQLGQRMYGVDYRQVGHVPPNEPEQLEKVLKALSGRVSAVVVEPVIGTAALPLEPSYVAALLSLRREHGYLLVADEVTTGFGRVGNAVFETMCWPEAPDLVISSKGLTNGTLAASAVIVREHVARTFAEHDAVLGHAETQGGTAVVGAAVLATIAEMERLAAVERSGRLGKSLDRLLADLADRQPLVVGSSGKGCLRAVKLAERDGTPLDRARIDAVVRAVREAGALVHPGPGCVQLVPALIYTEDELDELLACVCAGLAAVVTT